MNLLKAAETLIHTRGMRNAYFHWICSRLTGRGPFVDVDGGARVGHNWINFSEYWSYQSGNFGSSPSNSLTPAVRTLIQSSVDIAEGKSVAVDAGANIGIFTAAFAAAGFSEVHAFEPVPATFARLAENVAMNHFGSRVKLNPLALGDEEKVSAMRYDERSPATAHIAAEATPGTCPIEITTLDRYAELNRIPHVDFLKIDTEGYETAVLRGAATLLREKRVSLILLEWCPELLIRAGSGPDELWDTLKDVGYVLHLVSSTGKVNAPPTCEELKSMPWANLIAVPA